MASWLSSHGIVLGVEAVDVPSAIRAAIPSLVKQSGLDEKAVDEALLHSARETDAAIGLGIAVPHAAIAGLRRPVVVLVRLSNPIDAGAMDRMAVDLLFVTLFPADDPAGHLAFLAHLAHLAHSRVFREGLRNAAVPGEILALLEAAELRHAGSAGGLTPEPDESSFLAVISLAGEKAVDAALVGLLDAGFADAAIIDAQNASEAASREVPLFTAFQDIFGDPGGRRVILALVSDDQREQLTHIVRRACEEWQAVSGEISFVPVASRWQWKRVTNPVWL